MKRRETTTGILVAAALGAAVVVVPLVVAHGVPLAAAVGWGAYATLVAASGSLGGRISRTSRRNGYWFVMFAFIVPWILAGTLLLGWITVDRSLHADERLAFGSAGLLCLVVGWATWFWARRAGSQS